MEGVRDQSLGVDPHTSDGACGIAPVPIGTIETASSCGYEECGRDGTYARMAQPPAMQPLVAAEAALRLGLAKPWEIVAALQAAWDATPDHAGDFERELGRIAGINEEGLQRLRVEVVASLARANSDPGRADACGHATTGVFRTVLGPPRPDSARVPADPPSTSQLRRVGESRYVAFHPAGEGGMGIVYWALDTEMNRQVAFKIVRPDALAGAPGAPPGSPLHVSAPEMDTSARAAFEELKWRFLQEAWVTGALEHPGIVPVYELGQTPEGVPYYTMRFVRGRRTLASAIEEVMGAPIDARIDLLEPFLKVCDTVAYAHSRGVIHRDLKPANVALGEFGEVVLLDWGLARIRREEGREAQSVWQRRIRDLRRAAAPETDTAVGTPGYMAPEAASADPACIDERCDVYSLGAILFQVLTGRLPHAFRTLAEYVLQSQRGLPATPSEAGAALPQGLFDLCRRALAPAPKDRIRSVRDLAAEVRAWRTRTQIEHERDVVVREARRCIEAAAATDGENAEVLDQVAHHLERARALGATEDALRPIREKRNRLRDAAVTARVRGERRRAVRRVAIVAVALMAAIAMAAAWLLEGRRREAVRTREEAVRLALASRANEIAAMAMGEQDSSPQRALLLALEAVRRSREGLGAVTGASARALRSVLAKTGGVGFDAGIGPAYSADHCAEAHVLAVGGAKGRIALWDIRNRNAPQRRHWIVLPATSFAPDDVVSDLRFTRDGSWLFAARYHPDVYAFRRNGMGAYELRSVLPCEGNVETLALDPGGTSLAVGDWDGGVTLWRFSEPEPTDIELGRGERVVTALEWSTDGRALAAGDRAGTIRLWTTRAIERGDAPREWRAHDDEIRALVWGPEERWLVSAADEGELVLSDLQGAEPPTRRVLSTGRKRVGGVACAANGSLIATTIDNEYVEVDSLDATGAVTNQVRLTGATWSRSLALSSDGHWVAGRHNDHDVALWDMRQSSPELVVLRGTERWPQWLGFIDRDDALLCVSSDGQVRTWALPPDQATSIPVGLGSGTIEAADYALSPDGRRLAIASKSGGVTLCAVDSFDVLNPSQGSRAEVLTASDPTAIAWLPDGRNLLVAERGKGMRMVSTESDTAGPPIDVPGGDIQSLVVSPTGHHVGIVQTDAIRVCALGVEGVTVLAQAVNDYNAWGNVGFTPTGDRAILGDRKGRVHLVHIPSGTARSWAAHSDAVTCVLVAPTGDVAFSGGRDGLLLRWRLLDAAPLKPETLFSNRTYGIFGLAGSRDGRWLAALNAARPTLFDLQAEDPTLMQRPLAGEDWGVRAGCFSNDNRTFALVTGGSRMRVVLVDLPAPGKAPATPIESIDQGSNYRRSRLQHFPAGWPFFPPRDRALILPSPYRVFAVPLTTDDTVRLAERAAGRNLDATEWATTFPGERARRTIDALPYGPGVAEDRLRAAAKALDSARDDEARAILESLGETESAIDAWLDRAQLDLDVENVLAAESVTSHSCQGLLARVRSLRAAPGLTAAPDDPDAWAYATAARVVARMARGPGRSELRLVWDEARESSPVFSLMAASSLSTALEVAAQAQDAVACLEYSDACEALGVLDHVSIRALNAAAWTVTLRGMATRALPLAEAAGRRAPKSLSVLDTLSVSRGFAGDLKGALEVLDRLLASVKHKQGRFWDTRSRWREDLVAGKSPFTPTLLQELADRE